MAGPEQGQSALEDLPPVAARVFWFITGYPRTIIALAFLFIAGWGSFLPSLVKDTTIDAFIDPSNQAIQYRNRVKDEFGLKDPIVVALEGDAAGAVYTSLALEHVRRLTDLIAGIENVDPDRVVSLATEKGMIGTETDLIVEPLIDDGPLDEGDASTSRGRVATIPLYSGSLVTEDGRATLIVAEVLDQHQSGKTYQAIRAALADEQLAGFSLQVAGTGAIDGYLAAYIDKDARQLQPGVFVVILIMLFFTFRTPRGVLLPLFVILGTVAGSIGSMAAFGISYFAISSALPVILVGISVADSIHLLTYYYHERELHPDMTSRELTARAASHVWRPLAFTSFTTILGFLGIATTSIMPPMMWFSVFAIVGVAVALLFSLTALPAALSLCKPRQCRALVEARDGGPIARLVDRIGRLALLRSGWVLAIFVLVLASGSYGAATLKVEREAIHNFKPSEPIRVADERINALFDGTTYLDVVIETDAPGSLYDPEVLRRIETLQAYAEGLEGVGGSVSIVDYLKPLHRAVNADDPAFYSIPDDPFLIEQLFLLHSATGDPTDFEEEVDPTFQTALVRIALKTSLFTEVSGIVRQVQQFVDRDVSSDRISATLSGRAALDYYWLSPLKESHFQSLIVSIVLIWLAAILLFRSVAAGTITVIPVLTAILMIYAVMGQLDIWLEPATSMFAPIAIGLGVDFSIHVVERLNYYIRQRRMFLMQAVSNIARVSGRALFFNFASIFLGFGVLTFSELPMLVRFGGLTMVALLASYLTALILLPALVSLFNTDRIFRRVRAPAPLIRGLAIVGIAGMVLGAVGEETLAQAVPDGRWYAEQVANRPEPEDVAQTMTMTLTDRKGRGQERIARMHRKTTTEERRTIITFMDPRSIRDTAFMTHDYAAAEREDNQWLYLPALRRSRRISASDRGDYFLGTDFTYEDIKDSTKFSLADYTFADEGNQSVEGRQLRILLLTPQNDGIASELGYSRVRVLVDEANWMPVEAEYWDTGGNMLKTIYLEDHAQVDGFWTARRIRAENHKTGHQTVFVISEIDYGVELALDMFTERALRSGF